MSGIVWLASYPKSGNTWLRVFLANLLSGAPADINQLNSAQLATREIYDRLTGWETADFSPAEFESLRLPAQGVFAEQNPGLPLKTHEVFADPADGQPRISIAATRCALYVIRNPLDVVASLSHHFGLSLDAGIDMMNDPKAELRYGPNEVQIPQLLCDWSAHVKSWVDAPGVSVTVLRYEDMLTAPLPTFLQACHQAGFPSDERRVAEAVEQASFERLRQQEAEKGFAERMTNRVFFRKGQSGGWREVLTESQVKAIVTRHADVMRRFGYLGVDGHPPLK